MLSLKRDIGLQSGVCGNAAVHGPEVTEKTCNFLRDKSDLFVVERAHAEAIVVRTTGV